MANIYEITRRQLYLLVTVASVLSVLIFLLGVVVGKNYTIPKNTHSPSDIVTRNSQDTSETDSLQDIENLREFDNNVNSSKPFVEDEGLTFYSELNTKDSNDDNDVMVSETKAFSTEKNKKSTDTTTQTASLPVPTQAPTPDPFATPAPGFSKAYVVQVSSVRKKAFADETLKKINKKGYPGYISKIKYNTGIINYRVRVGPYKTRKAADTIDSRLRKEFHFSPLVMQIKEEK